MGMEGGWAIRRTELAVLAMILPPTVDIGLWLTVRLALDQSDGRGNEHFHLYYS